MFTSPPPFLPCPARSAAIFISYLFAGLAALLASACYSELCAEFPVSGGSFSYIMVGR